MLARALNIMVLCWHGEAQESARPGDGKGSKWQTDSGAAVGDCEQRGAGPVGQAKEGGQMNQKIRERKRQIKLERIAPKPDGNRSSCCGAPISLVFVGKDLTKYRCKQCGLTQ